MKGISAKGLAAAAMLMATFGCGLPLSSQVSPPLATSAPAGTESPGGGKFKAATPISDVCSLLTSSDFQAILPGARPGVEQQTPDTGSLGFWSRDCKWDVGDTSVQAIELVIFGVTTEQGMAGLQAAARSGKTHTDVAGLGSEARYWVDDTDVGLWAISGSLSVDVTAYFLTPAPTEAQLHPLVAKVLGEIQP